MRVELSRRAEREIERIARWWQEQGSSPAAFLDELEQVIEHVETTSVLGVVYEAKARRTIHRRLLRKSGCHVYLVQKDPELVVIVSIWGARRRRGPRPREADVERGPEPTAVPARPSRPPHLRSPKP